MSLRITKKLRPQQIQFRARRKEVFLLIVAHSRNGVFDKSAQFLANALPGYSRKNVDDAIQSLKAMGDVSTIEADRGYNPQTGRRRSNLLRAVAIETFAYKEWVRGGKKKGAEPVWEPKKVNQMVTSVFQGSVFQGECVDDTGLNLPKMESVVTGKSPVTLPKEDIWLSGTPKGLSADGWNATRCAARVFQGDPLVAREIEKLGRELTETKAQQVQSPDNQWWGDQVADIELRIALLKGEAQ